MSASELRRSLEKLLSANTSKVRAAADFTADVAALELRAHTVEFAREMLKLVRKLETDPTGRIVNSAINRAILNDVGDFAWDFWARWVKPDSPLWKTLSPLFKSVIESSNSVMQKLLKAQGIEQAVSEHYARQSGELLAEKMQAYLRKLVENTAQNVTEIVRDSVLEFADGKEDLYRKLFGKGGAVEEELYKRLAQQAAQIKVVRGRTAEYLEKIREGREDLRKIRDEIREKVNGTWASPAER